MSAVNVQHTDLEVIQYAKTCCPRCGGPLMFPIVFEDPERLSFIQLLLQDTRRFEAAVCEPCALLWELLPGGGNQYRLECAGVAHTPEPPVIFPALVKGEQPAPEPALVNADDEDAREN